MDRRPNEDEISRGYFYRKKVVVYQYKKGYRFSVDAPILADFLPHCPETRTLEIGTGCGIVSLLALHRNKFSSVEGIEIQERLCRLARLNAEQNGLSRRFKVRQADFTEAYRDYGDIPLIFSNPPFRKLSMGRLSPTEEIRLARSEEMMTVEDLLRRSFSILAAKGSLLLILPSPRYEEIMTLARRLGFFVSKFRNVFSFKDGNPDRFLVQFTNHDTVSQELKPLVIFEKPGVYSEEMERIFSGS
jgi:tRNA1Val (adenine37-N6)-methyltransferase